MPTLDARYKINGLIDTSQNALDNLTNIVNSCNTWLSYDALVGKWAVVINQAGSSEYSFSGSNIIGPVNMTTTDLSNFYNSVEVRFHNFELRDKEDYVVLEIPAGQRLPNEPDKRLVINAPLVNNQIQAQLLGLIELKQCRLDKVIQFTADFSYINIEAGSIISVTNVSYGWTNKLFRVLQLTEKESNGVILIEITAQEYDNSIYSEADLYEYVRDTDDGLIELDPLSDVSPISPSSAVVDSNGNSLLGLLGANALMALVKGLAEDKSTGPGSLYDSYNTAYADQNGVSLAGQAVMISGGIVNQTNQTVAPTGNSFTSVFTSPTFTPVLTGTFKADVIVDQNGSGAQGAATDIIRVQVRLIQYGTNTVVMNMISGGEGSWYWNDYAMTALATLSTANQYYWEFLAMNNVTSVPSSSASFDVGINLYTFVQ